MELTTGDFDILWLLASRAGNVVTRDEILRVVRGIDYNGLDRSIDARISSRHARILLGGGDAVHPGGEVRHRDPRLGPVRLQVLPRQARHREGVGVPAVGRHERPSGFVSVASK